MTKIFIALALLGASDLAFASGFYVPPWAEALFWLLLTPSGWLVIGAITAALVTLIVRKVRR